MKLQKLSGVMAASCLICLNAFTYAEPTKQDPTTFRWSSSEPLILPPEKSEQTIYGVKDPSIVQQDGKYHVFLTTAGSEGWGLAYTSFSTWEQAAAAPITGLDKSPMGPGYRAAPQVFFFAPQKLWYLIYQGGDPLYSTSSNIDDPLSWSAPKPFYPTTPKTVIGENGQSLWLDFWNICDDTRCYLFFTNDHGDFYRAETTIKDYPNGFGEPELVMSGATRDDLFEASNTYKIEGLDLYLTLVEAISSEGRYFRAWVSDTLDGDWRPLTPDRMNVFADARNVDFEGRAWSEGVSHGEMLRASSDQTLAINPCKPLQFLYQGLDKAPGKTYEYIQLPYRLGLLTASTQNPISALCNSNTESNLPVSK